MKFVLVIFALTLYTSIFGQLSPPGLGKVHSGDWQAIGINQKLDSTAKHSLLGYFGLGRTSNPKNYNPFTRAVIYVVNAEYQLKHVQNWSSVAALSYRWQNNYSNIEPFNRTGSKQEVRLYGKINYKMTWIKSNLTFTVRPEWRMFFQSNFDKTNEPFQFRQRLKAKYKLDLTARKNQQLILSSEFLFLSSKTDYWSSFEYEDARICLYYSITPKNHSITLDIGYMNNLIGIKNALMVHYIAFDVIWKNPFSRKS